MCKKNMSQIIICRLCLYNGAASYYNVFELKVVEKIQKLLNIEIKENDSHPKQICIECVNKLEDWNQYIETVQLNQDVFLLQSNLLASKKLEEEYGTVTSYSKEPELLNEKSGELYTVLTIYDRSFESQSSDNLVVDSPDKSFADLRERNDESDSDVEIDYDDPSRIFNESKEQDEAVEFPKTLIKDAKLIIRGKQLNQLLSRFYRLECDLCVSKSKKDIYSLFGHYKSVHHVKGYVVCCATKFYKARAMALHMSRHLDPEAFRCPDCNKLLTCPKILQLHRQNHLPESERPLACKKCPRRFSYNSALAAHAISHIPEDERETFRCTECSKTFCSSGRLSSHINLTHSKNGQEFICHFCAKSFTSKGNLTYHLTTHQPNIHSVQCKLCRKWLRNKICLRKHMIQHSEKKFSCHICHQYDTVNKQCLLNHIKVKHESDKPFECEVCKKTFKLKNTLINHLRQHSNEKPYACEFCNRKFASSGNFYSHRKRMHAAQVSELKANKERQAELQRKGRELGT